MPLDAHRRINSENCSRCAALKLESNAVDGCSANRVRSAKTGLKLEIRGLGFGSAPIRTRSLSADSAQREEEAAGLGPSTKGKTSFAKRTHICSEDGLLTESGMPSASVETVSKSKGRGESEVGSAVLVK